jgi:transposase
VNRRSSLGDYGHGRHQGTQALRISHDALRLGPGESVHVGVDIKATFHAAVLSIKLGLLSARVQHARPEVLTERLRPICSRVAQAVNEAGPTGFLLVRRLRAAVIPSQVIATKMLTPVGREAKCDRLDCRQPSQPSSKGLLHPVRVPTEQEADRQVLLLREQLARKARSIRQQIKTFLLQHGFAEPPGLAHWAERAIESLRRREIRPELRYFLDVKLDELRHN